MGREESGDYLDELMGNVREDGWANRIALVVYYTFIGYSSL
jgi:hypothetical protein